MRTQVGKTLSHAQEIAAMHVVLVESQAQDTSSITNRVLLDFFHALPFRQPDYGNNLVVFPGSYGYVHVLAPHEHFVAFVENEDPQRAQR